MSVINHTGCIHVSGIHVSVTVSDIYCIHLLLMSKCGEGLMPLSWERLWKSSTELCRLVMPADDDDRGGREEPEIM